MESAGRILLMPKGDYSASETYAMLDMVNHSGASWVCKKACTGQAPSDSNTEFWQRFGTAVDLSNYFKNTGGTVTGDIEVKKTTTDSARVKATSKGGVSVGITANDVTSGMYDFSGGKWVLENCNTDTPKLNGIATKNLPINGGGTVSSTNRAVVNVNCTNENGTTATIGYYLLGSLLGEIGVSSTNGAIYRSDGIVHSMLHTGNKPTGTYTGNGSATARTIATGGIGSCVMVRKSGERGIFAIVTESGYYAKDGSNGEDAYFASGVLTIASTSNAFNTNGATYYYQVL